MAYKYSKLARALSDQGHIVIVSTISLFKQVHDFNKSTISKYLEVFIKVGITELKRRDPKIYKKFDDGTLNNVVGLDLPILQKTST